MKNYSFRTVEACNMCGFKDTSRFLKLGFRLDKSQGLSPRRKSGVAVTICKCPRCSLIFPDPVPVPRFLSDHYGTPAEAYWKDYYFEVADQYFAHELATARRLTGRASGGRALDIGAGVGKAMVALQRDGWDVLGIEPSTPFYENAISRMNIDPARIQNKGVEDASFEPAYFDFVTFGAVLEHLYDPASAIGIAMEWLKPSGVVQIEVPSSAYLWHKLLNAYYRLAGYSFVANLSPMHAPFHIYEFSLKSFELLASRLGTFRVIEHRYEAASGRFIHPYLYRFLNPLMKNTDTGMQLTVYLQKQ